MQGELIIGTDLKTDKFDRKLEKLEAKYKNEEIDLKLKFNEYEKTENELLETKKNLNAIKKERDEINKKTSATRERYDFLFKKGQLSTIAAGEYNELQSLKRPLESLEENQGKINAEYDKMVESATKLNERVEKVKAEFEKQKNKVEGTRKEIEFINAEIEKNKINEMNSRFDGVKANIREIGKGIEKNIKKISRWALAIFGIRGAYMAVRNAINVISQEDEQLKADIDYMKKTFAYVLEPVARKVVELAKEIMYIIGYILKSVSGGKIDIFSKADKNLASANKSAKELSKTLAGFDEMNVLNDNSGSESGGGISSPSFNAEDFIAYETKINGAINKFIDKWFIENIYYVNEI